jgi:transcriptional regulator with XRE-family HTH domain
MLQREALAGALRAIRSLRKLQYGDLARSTSKSHLGDLEAGKRTVTLEKLADLADALHIDLTALVALTISIQRDEPCELTLSRASSELLNFHGAGGHDLVAAQYLDGVLQARPAGKPKRGKDLEAVKAMKAAGLTRADAVARLGLARTTVQRYWNELS